MREMYLQHNPAKGLSVEDSVKNKDNRDPFTLGQLKVIFDTDIYRQQRKDALTYKPKSKNQTAYARYWIPLISLWTGMRLNEICQLYVSDITILSKVHVILIRDTDGENGEHETKKRVKTESGIRVMPIHPLLAKAGLLDYVKSVKKAGETKVFPSLMLDTLPIKRIIVGPSRNQAENHRRARELLGQRYEIIPSATPFIGQG